MVFIAHLAAVALMGDPGIDPSAPFQQGSLLATGRPLDLALCGSGYFILGSARKPSFTRNGAFALDRGGRLVSRTLGKPVLGWQDGVLRPLVFRLRSGGEPLILSVAKDGTAFGRYGNGVTSILATIAVAGFQGALGTAGQGGLGSIESGFLEDRGFLTQP